MRPNAVRPNGTIVYNNGERHRFSVGDPAEVDNLPFRYFRDALRSIVEQWHADGLHFVLVDQPSTPLPRLGDDVVVLLFADEVGQVVPYAQDVRAVFKSFGTRPEQPPPARSTSRRLVDRARLYRDQASWLAAATRQWRRGREAVPDNVHIIPPSYDAICATPAAASFLDRRYAISFCGSIRHTSHSRTSPRHWLGTPKDLARKAMVEALGAYDRQRQQGDILVEDTGSFANSIARGPARYIRVLQDTMIAAVPRGSHTETYRLFDAMSAGCIIVCEPLPQRWYLKDSPIITLADWSDAARVLDPILADRQGLLARHRATTAYWHSHLSSAALANFMARTMALPARQLERYPSN
jgi:hypothetical protein